MMRPDSKKTTRPVESEKNKYDPREKDISQVTVPEKKEVYKQFKKKLAEFDKESSVNLPEDWVYSNIDEAVKNCRKIYLIFIAVISYSLLTIATTSDRNLFLGQNLKLPILDVSIPLNFFLLFVPPLAIGLYTYMQLYLLKVNKLIEFAITICSKTNPECEKDLQIKCDLHIICPKHQNRLYPWMQIFSRWSEGFLGWLQKVFGKFSIWWLLPTTQLVLSLFIIKKHDPKSIFFQLFFTLAGTSIVLAFWVHNKSWELKIEKIYSFLFQKIILSLHVFYRILFKGNKKENIKIIRKMIGELKPFREGFAILVSILSLSLFLILLSGMAQEGKLWWVKDAWSDEVGNGTKIIRSVLFANLSQEKLNAGSENDKNFDSFKWLNLEGFRLEGANFVSTPLKKAKLQKTKLKYANLNKANLEYTNFEHANLNFATLVGASLKGANLKEAQLENTNLDEANLQMGNLYKANLKYASLLGANLQKTNLFKANLEHSNLEGANLAGANLQKANLFHADLSDTMGITKKQLEEAVNWQLAFYSPEDILKFGLNKDHNKGIKENNFYKFNLSKTNLQGANLINTTLEKADLSEANLQEADLKRTNLQGAILTEANLKNAVLRGANLQETFLERADLQGADLREINWDERDKNLFKQHERNQKFNGYEGKLFNAKNYLLALYDKDMLAILKLPADHNDRVKKKDLSGYDLSNANLQEADLQEINLRGANLNNSNLKKAILTKADIQHVSLIDANLQGAVLTGTKGISSIKLLKAKNCKLAFYSKKWLNVLGLPEDHNSRLITKNFETYKLEGANLQEADLWGFNLRKANLQKANLTEALLGEANLEKANLQGANLEKTDLMNANLSRSNLQEINLNSASLIGTDLEQADLTGAKLEKANLFRSNLRQTILKDANIDQSNLKEANLQGAYLENVKNITEEQLYETTNWQLAYYSEYLLKKFGLPVDHNARVRANNYSGYDFRMTNLKKAFLKEADLSKANLQGTNLQEADLRQADLNGAQLEGADIKWANLSGAIGITPPSQLTRAKNYQLAFYSKNVIDRLGLPPDHNRRVKKRNLSGYDLQKANLQDTDLQGANLKGANLHEALLNGTRLGEANLQGAKFYGAIGITRDQLEQAVNWQLAFYSLEDLSRFGLPEDHNTRVIDKNFSAYDFRIANLKRAELEKADLSKANLRGADLQEADLRKAKLLDTVLWEANLQDAVLKGANIRGADLDDANFQGADLRDIIFFNYKQFSTVKTLYQCQLNDTLRLQLSVKYPNLFEEMIEE